MVRRTGQMGVPVTEIGGEMVVGFDRPRLERLIARLRVTAPPATLGAAVKDVPGGVLVGTVHPGTPAARAGMRPGDVILAVDGRPVGGSDMLSTLVDAARARGHAVLEVRRDASSHRLRVSFSPP